MSGSYTQSESYQGSLAQLSIGPIAGTASPTFTAIFEVTKSPLPEAKYDLLDVTNLNSSVKEFRKGMPDMGDMEVTGNAVSGDPGQLAMAAAWGDAVNPYMFEIQMPKSPTQTTMGDLWKFNGLVLGWTPLETVEAGKTVTWKASIKIVSKPLVTAGS